MSFLTHITHNLPWFLRDPAVSLLGTECYTTLVYNLDLDDVRCLRFALSKVLGLGIVVGGSIVKVPQIMKIVSAKSARGLSLGSYLLDTASLLLVVGYNWRSAFPFSTYGENIFLLVQNLVIISLIVLLSRHPLARPLAAVSVIVSAALLFICAHPILPLDLLRALFALSIPLSLASKVPQILQNHRRSSTGQLSAFLVINSLAGCLARVFTTATETGDAVMWWSFVGASALNGILAIQLIAYWKSEESLQDEIKVTTGRSSGAPSPRLGYGHEPKQRLPSSRSPAKHYVRKAD